MEKKQRREQRETREEIDNKRTDEIKVEDAGMKGECGTKEQRERGRSGRGRRKIKQATAISSKSDSSPSVLTFFD